MVNDLRTGYRWALARSKNSLTHLWSNVVIAGSVGFKAFDGVVAFLDPETNQAIVSTLGDIMPEARIASSVGLALMIVTKCARDRKPIPFTDADPH